MEALEAVAAVHLELSCPLCHKLMREPQTFNTPMCGHTFCRDCVIATLEGPGIVKSQCPTCKQPAWKKDLHTNHKYTAIAEATAHVAAVLRSQGLDFQLFDHLEEPIGHASDADVGDDAKTAGILAADAGNVVAPQPLATDVLLVKALCEDLEAIAPHCALEGGTNADVHPLDQAVACVAEQQPVLTAAEAQEEVIPDSGSGPAVQQQHCHPANLSLDVNGSIPAAAVVAGGEVSILADLVGMPVKGSSEMQQQIAQQQWQQLHSQGYQQPVNVPTLQPPQQQELQQQQLNVQQAPHHLLQHPLGTNDEQLPGRSYWHFEQVLQSMMDNLQVTVQQQQQQVRRQQQQDLPPCLSSILKQTLKPTTPEVQEAQQDLRDIDAMLADIDVALEGVTECHRLQQKQQPQCLRSQQQQQQHQVLHSCYTTCTSQDPTEGPSIAELQYQQQQQPAAAAAALPDRQVSLGKRRRGRASGRSRAAAAFSGGFLGKDSVGIAGESGVQLGACSGAGMSFSNCSGPLVGHTGRPSLERAIDAAMAAARAADSMIPQVQEVSAHHQQQLEAGEHKKHLQQPAPAIEQQQQQLGQQSAQQTTSTSMGGSAAQARSNRGRKARAAAGATAESQSLTSGTAGRRSSRRAAAAVTKALNAVSDAQPGNSIIGVRLKVYWPADKCYYTGRVTDYNPRSKRHTVAYEDGDVEQLDLTEEDYIPLFSENEQEQQHAGSRQQTDQRMCDRQQQQQQATDQDVEPNEVLAAERLAGQQQQQQNMPLAQQTQHLSPMQHQQQEPLASAHKRTAAAGPGDQTADVVGQQQPQPLQHPQVPHQPQQQSLWNLRQQLLQAKGLATSRQCHTQHHHQLQQQQQQQSVNVQQQESSSSSPKARRAQQQQRLLQQHQHHRRPVKSRVGPGGRKRKRRQHDCDFDHPSSSSSSLHGSDVTSGGDSAYEADGEQQDSDDSDEYAAATAAGAKRGEVPLESECVSDLEVAAAADSSGSDSFVKQLLKSRRAKAKRNQAAANRAKQQQQHKQRQRCHQAGTARWHSKRQQQQGDRRSCAALSMRQQHQPVLVPDSDADVVGDQTADISAGPNQHQKTAVLLQQQRLQQRRDQLLQQEAEAAWAVMEQQLNDAISSDLPGHSDSEQAAGSADEYLTIGAVPHLQHSTGALSKQDGADMSVDDAGQAAAEPFRPLAAAAAQQAINSSLLQEDAAFRAAEPAEQPAQQGGTSPMQQQHLHRVDQDAVAVVNATSITGPGIAAQRMANEGKYCDLLSDSIGTSCSSSQHLGSSEDHNENDAAADVAGLQPQQQAAGAGACGVLRAAHSSRRPVSKQQTATAKQRKPLSCVPADRQQLSAGALDGAEADKSCCMDVQAAAELQPLPSAQAAAAAAAADGCDAGVKRLVTVIGSMDKDTIRLYKQVLQAMGADFAKDVSDKYSHCVVVPVDEHGCFHSTNKAVLKALLLGLPLVKHTWLQDSVDQQCLLPVQDYLPKGQKKVPEGGPARSLAAKDHDRRLFEGLVVVAAAVKQTQVAVQQTLAVLAVMGGARTLSHGPGFQHLVGEPDRHPVAAAAAAELCKGWRVLVLLSDDKDHASARVLQQYWPSAEVVTANYLTECICAYRMLDSQPYRV